MKRDKKLEIITKLDSKRFYKQIFAVWARKKAETPNWMICFWCSLRIHPKKYFTDKLKYFEATRDGVIFENPTYGKHSFNKMYQNSYKVEMCNSCYYDLDMYNKTGLWFND